MHIGFLSATEIGETDRLIAALAEMLQARGVEVAGTVQTNRAREGAVHTDMDLWLLPNGPEIRISQVLGEGSTGCRLDAGALEGAVAEVARRLAGADVLIVNKFGRQETDGRGFRSLLGDALEQGIPVIIGVNPDYLSAFEEFSAGFAERLPNDQAAILAWLSRS